MLSSVEAREVLAIHTHLEEHDMGNSPCMESADKVLEDLRAGLARYYFEARPADAGMPRSIAWARQVDWVVLGVRVQYQLKTGEMRECFERYGPVLEGQVVLMLARDTGRYPVEWQWPIEAAFPGVIFLWPDHIDFYDSIAWLDDLETSPRMTNELCTSLVAAGILTEEYRY